MRFEAITASGPATSNAGGYVDVVQPPRTVCEAGGGVDLGSFSGVAETVPDLVIDPGLGSASLHPAPEGIHWFHVRTIDAVGAGALLLLDAGVDPYHPSAVRASLGSLFWVPVANATFAEFAAWSKQHGYHLYGSSAHGSVDFFELCCPQRPNPKKLGIRRVREDAKPVIEIGAQAASPGCAIAGGRRYATWFRRARRVRRNSSTVRSQFGPRSSSVKETVRMPRAAR